MDDVKGRIGPVVVAGEAPEGVDEILLASKTLRALGLQIGDTVDARDQRSVRLRIVGRGVLPESVSYRAAAGGGNDLPGLQAAESVRTGVATSRLASRPVLTGRRRSCGWSGSMRIRDRVRRRRSPISGACANCPSWSRLCSQRSRPPCSLTRCSRRSAGDAGTLAVLKTLGFDRRQLLATVAWQATTFAVIGLAVGIPLGIAAGRWAWYLFADQIEVVPEPVTPLLLILLVVPTALLLANLVAALPGWSAAQTRAAAVLRAE